MNNVVVVVTVLKDIVIPKRNIWNTTDDGASL